MLVYRVEITSFPSHSPTEYRNQLMQFLFQDIDLADVSRYVPTIQPVPTVKATLVDEYYVESTPQKDGTDVITHATHRKTSQLVAAKKVQLNLECFDHIMGEIQDLRDYGVSRSAPSHTLSSSTIGRLRY